MNQDQRSAPSVPERVRSHDTGEGEEGGDKQSLAIMQIPVAVAGCLEKKKKKKKKQGKKDRRENEVRSFYSG